MTTLKDVAENIDVGVRGDDQLDLSTDIRNILTKELIDSGAAKADPKVANVVLAALKANDTVVLAKKRLEVDKDNGDNNAAAIIEASLNLKAKHGHNMVPVEDLPTNTTSNRDTDLDASEFEFNEGESIVGVDTEAALNETA